MVYGIILHSILPNPTLVSLAALMQQYQLMTIGNVPGTPSKSSSSSKDILTPSKISQPIGLASPAATTINANASNSLSFPGASLIQSYAGNPNDSSKNSMKDQPFVFNGISLTPSQAGISGGPPENVTVFISQFYDNLDGNTANSEPLAQAIASQSAAHFYQQKQMQIGLSNLALQDESKRKRNLPVTPSSSTANVDSVWASPALQIAGENIPTVDGIYELPPNKITGKTLYVVWKQVESCIFSLICYEDENRSLALDLLQSLPKLLADQYKNAQICSVPREIMSRPDEVLSILNTYLPRGSLQLLPSSLVKQLKREADLVN